jgi:hypothetical protein
MDTWDTNPLFLNHSLIHLSDGNQSLLSGSLLGAEAFRFLWGDFDWPPRGSIKNSFSGMENVFSRRCGTSGYVQRHWESLVS